MSILGFFGSLISIMTSDFRFGAPPAVSGSPPPAVKPYFYGNDRYTVMHVDFGIIRVADLYNDLRF